MSSYSLSSTSGRRLCKVNGGKYDGRYIYLYDSKYKCCPNCSKDCNNKCCQDCGLIKYHKSNDMLNNEPKIVSYCDIKDDGEFIQVPTNIIAQRDCAFIPAKAGAGKSVYVSQFLKEYRLLNPNNKVFLFSMKKKDENLDPYIHKRVNLDKYIEKGGLTIDDFPENCVIVFDDIDVLDNSKPDHLRDNIFKLMNQVIQVSRSKNISVIQTSHVCLGNQETKHMLNAMTSFTFFTSAISAQVRTALKTYAGLTKEQLKKVLNLKNTRWVTIIFSCPIVVLTQKECFILDN